MVTSVADKGITDTARELYDAGIFFLTTSIATH